MSQSVSCTTRLPRPGEKNGRQYHFLSREEFRRRIRRGDLLEWAMVHDEYYGTPRTFIERTLARGGKAVLAIDVQGARSIRRKLPDNSVLIFLAPPSMGVLRRRLLSRKAPHDSVSRRLADARFELGEARHFDYIVLNADLGEAVSNIDAVITAEDLRAGRLFSRAERGGRFNGGLPPILRETAGASTKKNREEN